MLMHNDGGNNERGVHSDDDHNEQTFKENYPTKALSRSLDPTTRFFRVPHAMPSRWFFPEPRLLWQHYMLS
jgi:hypothetical protein